MAQAESDILVFDRDLIQQRDFWIERLQVGLRRRSAEPIGRRCM
jgi:hypothetical protein